MAIILSCTILNQKSIIWARLTNRKNYQHLIIYIMNKKVIYLIIGIIVVVVALFAFNKFLKKEVIEEPLIVEIPVEIPVEIISVNNLVVPNQAPGTEIFIERVLLKTDGNGGFVIIHRTEDNNAGEIVGVSNYIEPGITDNVTTLLNDGETVEIDEVLIAILHGDDGDGVWNSETDTPLTDDEGSIIQVTFTIIDNLEDVPGFEAKL